MFNTLLNGESVNWAEIFNTFVDWVVDWCLNTGLKLILGLLILFISFKIINFVARKIEKKGGSEKFDKTVMRTLAYLLRIALKVVVAICVIAFVGFDVSGLTALVASFGVCIGLAVNGALSNIAGGVLLLVTRPFKVDDFIEAQGISGTVEDIHMVSTKIVTPDNKVVYVPNGPLANNNIINYSEKNIRRVDFSFSIDYSNDIEKAKDIVLDIISSHELALKDPAPFVRMNTPSDSALIITARVWVNSADYWTVNFDVLERVKAAFDSQGIVVPFNQLDVHIKKD